MKKIITNSIALGSVIVLSGCSLTGQEIKKGDIMMEKEALEKNDSMMEKEDSMVKENNAMMKEENDTMMQKDDSMVQAGSYTTYSESAVTAALAAKKNVVLFFHAPWCPSCKAADTGLLNSTAPENMVVFKTDYDTNTELRKKYGVTSQHTFVSINADGSLKKKSSGEKTYAEITELF